MRLGIFGGTFDPPHIGHLILASEAQEQLALDRVLWVLTPHPPHKTDQKVTSTIDRLDLLRLALGDDQHFEISRVDIDRPPPHFAVDTLRLLHAQFPQATLVFLMGSDSLDDLPQWHTPRDFLHECDELGVMCRPGREIDLSELEKLLPGASGRVYFLEAPLLEISSTRLREKIADGGSYRYYLPPAVWRLIEEKGLYSERSA
jgi:nicotinate-nucleotide adenylyltransferase